MSRWFGDSRPPGPGPGIVQEIGLYTSQALLDIKISTDHISHVLDLEQTHPYLQQLAVECWGQIELCQRNQRGLLSNWGCVENYRELLCEIQVAIYLDTMTDDKAEGFRLRLHDFLSEFQVMKRGGSPHPCPPVSTSGSIIQDVGQVNIYGGKFIQITDPGLSAQLKQIRNIQVFFTMTIVLF